MLVLVPTAKASPYELIGVRASSRDRRFDSELIELARGKQLVKSLKSSHASGLTAWITRANTACSKWDMETNTPRQHASPSSHESRKASSTAMRARLSISASAEASAPSHFNASPGEMTANLAAAGSVLAAACNSG